MINYEDWKSDIISSISYLADRDYQKNVWLGKSDNLYSSFDEDIMTLYDDNCFEDDFWADKHFNNFNFTGDQVQALKKIKDKLDEYLLKVKEEEQKYSDEFILNDPQWIEITKIAAEVISHLR